jgi:predicted DNA-binding transcriptional regulator AlpA
MSELDRVLSLKEVAAALGVHRTTLHTWRREGNGPPVVQLSKRKVGVRTSDLNAFIEARVIQPGAAEPPCDRDR